MSNRAASYIAILQQLAVARRKDGTLSQMEEAAFADGMNVCRDGMTPADEQILDRVVSEFSCLRATVTRKATCLDDMAV
jgi:hypothetical protein